MAISHWELAVINVIEGIMASPIRLIPINTTTIVLISCYKIKIDKNNEYIAMAL